MSDLDGSEPSRGGRATPLWVGAIVLAACATAVLVLSDDSRLLKLALVAALWAALLSAFAVAKLRGQAVDGEQRAAELERVYQQELEREVSARREFEAEAEAEARRRAAADSAQEIQALRAELNNLRQTLEQVVGGDVLFERVALRAESTRMRSLAERGGAAGSAARLHPVDGRNWGFPAGRDDVQAGSPAVEQARADRLASNAAAPNPGVPDPAAPDPAAPGPAVPNPAAAFPAAPNRPPPSRPAQHPPPAANATGGNAPDDEADRSADERVAEQRTQMFSAISAEPSHSPAPHADGSDTPPAGMPAPQRTGDSADPGAAEGEFRQPASDGAPVASATPWTSRTRTGSTPPPESPRTVSAAPGAPADQSEEQQSSQVEGGAHAEGTSVTELLAAYGESTESQPRRRRRD